MILIHLHLCDIASLNVIRCNSILTAQHIQALHIELVDGLSLILDLSAWSYLDSRQLLQHISNAPVSRILEVGHIVRHSILLPLDSTCFDLNLLNLQRRILHTKIQSSNIGWYNHAHLGKIESGNRNTHRICIASEPHLISSFTIAAAIAEKPFAVSTLHKHISPGNHLAVLFSYRTGYRSFDDRGLAIKRYSHKRQEYV